jgi:hypothetical protein
VSPLSATFKIEARKTIKEVTPMARIATQKQRSALPTTQNAEPEQPTVKKQDGPAGISRQITPLPGAQKARSEQRTRTENDVRTRAYELYLERGGVPGSEVDDWLQAERELLAD